MFVRLQHEAAIILRLIIHRYQKRHSVIDDSVISPLGSPASIYFLLPPFREATWEPTIHHGHVAAARIYIAERMICPF